MCRQRNCIKAPYSSEYYLIWEEMLDSLHDCLWHKADIIGAAVSWLLLGLEQPLQWSWRYVRFRGQSDRHSGDGKSSALDPKQPFVAPRTNLK